MVHYTEFDYSIMSKIKYIIPRGRGDKKSVNDIIIMADTETSKKDPSKIGENHVVAWTVSMRAYGHNIATLYGSRPSELIWTLTELHEKMLGVKTIIYFHNYAYDYVFLRKFMYDFWGIPTKVLNTNSHYPINMEFINDIVIRDSLILAQRKLEKWADDMNVEHKKAVGKWDYDKVRNQDEPFTADELQYIECDTLAGVECLQATKDILNKEWYAMPYTATGIPREETVKRAKEYGWQLVRDKFFQIVPTYEQQMKLEKVYHGGFTHGNRHFINTTITETVQGLDFSSSYPFNMLARKYPMGKFLPANEMYTVDEILKKADRYAYMFRLNMLKPRLKNDNINMPVLQASKCTELLDPVLDNGRVLCCTRCSIYVNEVDLSIIAEQYDWDKAICDEVEYTTKAYLPRWFTDYVFECYQNKTTLKGGDPVAYALAKAKLNSLYGMCVQHPIKETINENYGTGEYSAAEDSNPVELYAKYLEGKKNVLVYQWGCWVTSYAMRNLFNLGKCCDTWLYSDTDSCYAIGWHWDMIEKFNEQCKADLQANNYGCVPFNGKDYWLGIAEADPKDIYTEFRYQGAKRYCGRAKIDGELHITVAGVPKKNGAKCLQNDINNFKPLLIFDGVTTGKLQHTYFYVNDIYTDANGNETGDSIDLSPCDYILDSNKVDDWENIFREEINIQVCDFNFTRGDL